MWRSKPNLCYNHLLLYAFSHFFELITTNTKKKSWASTTTTTTQTKTTNNKQTECTTKEPIHLPAACIYSIHFDWLLLWQNIIVGEECNFFGCTENDDENVIRQPEKLCILDTSDFQFLHVHFRSECALLFFSLLLYCCHIVGRYQLALAVGDVRKEEETTRRFKWRKRISVLICAFCLSVLTQSLNLFYLIH